MKNNLNDIYSTKGLLTNFQKLGESIPVISGFVRIGDFPLYKDGEEKIIDDAKVGFSVYGVSSLTELLSGNVPITVAIPALTGNAKIFSQKSSQGSGWANPYALKDGILEVKERVIIGLDYFGGPYDSSGPKKHDFNFYPVPPEKQVEAWKKALHSLGVRQISTLFGGSNGGGHIHRWLFDDNFPPDTLIPIAGPVYPEADAREFFKMQVDFIKYHQDISTRVQNQVKDLLGKNELYDSFVSYLMKELSLIIPKWDTKKAITLVRALGFLKFVNPEFFGRFWQDKDGNNLNKIKAEENIVSYFAKEGENFEKRFSLSSLALLCQGIADSSAISPLEYVSYISKKVNIINVVFAEDKLFNPLSSEDYFTGVRNLREARGDSGETENIIIPSTSETIQAGHDSFLWDSIVPEISREVRKYLV